MTGQQYKSAFFLVNQSIRYFFGYSFLLQFFLQDPKVSFYDLSGTNQQLFLSSIWWRLTCHEIVSFYFNLTKKIESNEGHETPSRIQYRKRSCFDCIDMAITFLTFLALTLGLKLMSALSTAKAGCFFNKDFEVWTFIVTKVSLPIYFAFLLTAQASKLRWNPSFNFLNELTRSSPAYSKGENPSSNLCIQSQPETVCSISIMPIA